MRGLPHVHGQVRALRLLKCQHPTGRCEYNVSIVSTDDGNNRLCLRKLQLLSFLYDETPGETAMHKINKVDYEAVNSGIEIRPEPSTEAWVEKTLAAVVAGTAPDLIMGWADVFVNFRSRNVFEDITDSVKAWPDLDDFWPASLSEVGVVEGRTYGIPYCFDPVTIYYFHQHHDAT